MPLMTVMMAMVAALFIEVFNIIYGLDSIAIDGRVTFWLGVTTFSDLSGLAFIHTNCRLAFFEPVTFSCSLPDWVDPEQIADSQSPSHQ